MNGEVSAYAEGPLAPVTLRIGITGHRPDKLADADLAALSRAIGRVLRDLFTETQQLCQSPDASLLYRETDAPPRVRIFSALAEGADRIAVDRGRLQLPFPFDLVAVLPFLKDEYARDFRPEQSLMNAGSVDEFDRLLLAASQVVELDGVRERAEAAYRQAGQYIVAHSDVLIAVWDEGDCTPGVGGTADVIELALSYGLLVICVDPQAPERLTLRRGMDRSPLNQTRGADPYDADIVAEFLQQHLFFSSLLREQDVDDDEDVRRREEIKKRLTDFVEDVEVSFREDEASQADFVENGPLRFKRSAPFLWGKVFGVLSSWLAPKRAVDRQIKKWRIPVPDLPNPAPSLLARAVDENAPPHRIFAAFLRADRLASYYAMLHRSVFMSIYLLGGLALSAAAAALYFHKEMAWGIKVKYGFAGLEFLFLLAILLLWFSDHKRRYHDRWIEYRSLAEFLRPMIYLPLVGWVYPLNALRNREEEIGRNRLGHSGPARSWVFMVVETIVRWAGTSTIKLDEPYLRMCREYACSFWIDRQIRYHIRNAAQMHILAHRLHRFSFLMFWGTMVAVMAKLVDAVSDHALHADVAGLLAGVLPALGAAAFAIRNHAEFEISAQRSQTMRIRLIRHRSRLERATRSSKQIGREMLATAESTIRETSDWGEIFEVKESEAG